MFKHLVISVFIILSSISCSTVYKSNDDYELTKNVPYSDENKNLSADIWKPKINKEKMPAIVVVHGGGWTRRTRDDMNEICDKLTRAGFVVMNISYRLAPEHLFPAPIIDYLNAVQWLKENSKTYNIDSEKIAALGYSAGAHIVSLGALLRYGDKEDEKFFGAKNLKNSQVSAVIAGGSPMDIVMAKDSDLVHTFLGAKYDEKPELYKLASPLYQVHSKAPAFFMYHGENDWIVWKEHMDKMENEFKKYNVKYKTHVVSHVGHIATFLWSDESIELSVHFLKEHFNYVTN